MRIVLFLIFVAITLYIYSNENISKRLKVIFSLLLVFVAFLGYIYEDYIDKKESEIIKKVEFFKQGKSLICRENIKVDKAKFIYFNSTQTFAAKPNSGYPDMIISIDECKKVK